MPTKKLAELEPEFEDVEHGGKFCRALTFTCPACDGHAIMVPFAGASPFDSGAMWRLQGAEDISTATLIPSIHVRSGCGFHGFVTNGEVSW